VEKSQRKTLETTSRTFRNAKNASNPMNKHFNKVWLECLKGDLKDSLEYERMLKKLNPIREYGWANTPELKLARLSLRKLLRAEIRKTKKHTH